MIKAQQDKKGKHMKQTEFSTFDENIMSSGLTDSIFDRDGLLHRLMGDEDLAKEIIDDYLKQIPFNFNAVKEALNDQDVVRIKREAHIIKGASGNVGAWPYRRLQNKSRLPVRKKILLKLDCLYPNSKNNMKF